MNLRSTHSAKPPAPWGGVKNITRVARDKGIPPSVEKWMIKLNKFLRGCPPFLLSDVGRAIAPPITEGLDRLPLKTKKKVVIVGSGLAGMITALELAKLGYTVEIYEAHDYIGGKLGAKPSDTSPSGFWEHGLHHFFVNVYDFLMQKIEEIDAYKYMIRVNEVLLEFEDYEPEVLKVEPNVQLLNMLAIVFRSPNVTILDALRSFPGMLPIFFYNHEKVIAKYDDITMVEYSQKKIAKSFFDTFVNTVLTVSLNRPEDISAAQALHFMWTFFVRYPDAMNRVVPADNHYRSIMLPFRNHLAKLGVTIHTEHRVSNLELEDGTVKGIQFTNDKRVDCDYLVLATDLRNGQKILADTQATDAKSSQSLDAVRARLGKMKTSPPDVVARAYLLAKPNNPDRPDVIETPQNQPVDLIFQAHKTEKSDADWVKAAPVGEDRWVVEVHGYDLGPALAKKYPDQAKYLKNCSNEELWQFMQKISDEQIWDVLREELRDIEGLENLADAPLVPDGGLQVRRYFNFTGFQVGQGDRPAPFFAEEYIPNLFFAGDWVALQGKDGFEGAPGQVYPGGNLMGHAASAAGIAAGLIAAKDGVVGPYVSVI